MAEGTRLLVLLSFLLLFLVGVPIWWKTTEIYRAQLPDLAFSSEYKTANWPTEIKIYLPLKLRSETIEKARERIQRIPHRTTYTPVFNVELLESPLTRTHDTSDEHLDEEAHQKIAATGFAFIVLDTPTAPATGQLTWGKYNHALIRIPFNPADPSPVFDAVAEVAHSMFGVEASLSEQRVVLPPSVETRISFTLASGDVFPENIPLSAFSDAIEESFSSFLRAIAPLGNFSINSQTKQFVVPAKLPVRDRSKQLFQYTRDMLPYFVNLAEWNSDATSTEQGQVHLMMYLPAPSLSPLHIVEKNDLLLSNAFVIPRTGAVVIKNIYSAPDQPSQGIRVSDFTRVMRIFISQMRDLLGVHHWRSQNIKALHPKHGISVWELELLKRQQIWQNLENATASLQSVYRLVVAIPNMVVREEIRNLIVLAVASVNKATQHIAAGSYDEALKASREAFTLSEKVFFDPSMIAQLYFPDEHKYAIYIPMFFPMLLPVVSGLWSELKRRRQKKKTE